MAHNTTNADVQRAFDRYRTMTDDDTATLERIPQTQPAIYRLEGDGLRGEWVGAATTLYVIEAYCQGYRDGYEDGLAEREYEAQPIDMARAAGHNV